MSRFARLLPLFAVAALSTACGAATPHAAAPSSSGAAAAPSLERSLFSKDVTGALTEDDLQRVLDAPIQLEFPGRVGVVALDEAFRAERGADVTEQSLVTAAFTRAITGSPRFSHVTDVSTELPNPSGLEGLRTIAARYRIRYLLITSTRTEDTSHLNNWAWLYATGVGLFAAPGMTVSSRGLMHASLLDVRTGTVLLTASEPFQTSKVTWLVGHERDQRGAEEKAKREAAGKLARTVLTQTEQLVGWVEHAKETRSAARE
jgi:rhombotail lipoprotein